MIDNKTLIIQEFEKLKGQFVITQSHKIERLIAVIDGEDDYYWVTYNGRKTTWNTCVGSLVPLKGYLRDEDYNEFIRLAKINHRDQETLWCHKPEDIMRLKYNKYFPQEVIGITYAESAKNHKEEIISSLPTRCLLAPICMELN